MDSRHSLSRSSREFGEFSPEHPTRIDLQNGLYLLEYDSVSSTQDVARALVSSGTTNCAAVRADFQTLGRGRSGRDWFATAGDCLLATYILEWPADPASFGTIALAAGVGVSEAIERLTSLSAQLKWPNDVLLRGRKTAGILIEIVPNQAGGWVALFGIGVNANMAKIPPELEGRATSLKIETGRTYNIREIERSVRESLRSACEILQTTGVGVIIDLWRQRDATRGLSFVTTIEGQERKGVASGVSNEGALLLTLSSGDSVEVLSASALRE